ncbi:MAG: DUF4250 domain-containing protein [Clostridium sp.]|nr:DUF4250 domain-containing protein [Clostridium sp.]
MKKLPRDPVMCLSAVNAALRDSSESLDELCAAWGEEKEELIRRLAEAGFEFEEERRRFR